MEPPFVEHLTYAFTSLEPERFDFSEAADLSVTLGPFVCTLSAGRLKAEPQQRFETAEQARAALEPHLRRWELVSELRDGARIEFRHAGALVYQPNPATGSTYRV